VGAHSVADLAWIRAARLFDRIDDDVWRRQRACLFGQTATERLHELIVDFLSAEFGQELPHFGNVLVVTSPLLGSLLEHVGAARRAAWANTGRSTRSRRAHARSRWSGSHGTQRAWAARTARSHRRTTRCWCRKLGFKFTSASAPARPTGTRGWATPFAAELITAVLAARRAPSIAVERTVRVNIVGFEVPIDGLTAGACGTTPGCGLHHNERCVVLLGHLRRRKPGLLQRGILAEQRFLQRPSHTLSLKTLKFLAPPAWPSMTATKPRATPVTLNSFIRRNWQSCNVTRSPEVGARLTRRSWAFVEPTRPHGMRSSLTER